MNSFYCKICLAGTFQRNGFRNVLSSLLLLFLSFQSFAGRTLSGYAVANSSNYDLVYHRISITVNPAVSAAISAGSVTTYFITTVNNVSSIEFDLDGAMTVSSATYHGSAVTKSHNATTDILTLTIPTIAAAGTLDSVTINYSGTPILAPASGVPSGYNYKDHGSPAQKQIYTLGEPYTGHNWWPCKETLYDKIDSVTLIVTAPSTYKVAGNGLVTETPSGGNTITTWKTNYKIATYMINFAVANYVNYQFTINTSSVNLPVMNYLYAESNNATFKAAADLSKTILPMFASTLGTYPFLNEKYGLAECTAGWGALEVQSMTFIASDAYDKYTIAHELAHQWFGDKLTTNSWHQIWLNEGFATYCENIIFPENLYPAELAAKRASLKTSVSNTSKTYVADTTTPNNIFIGSGTQPYPKGAMILSMLRAWLGDANFFTALQNYLNSPGLAYGFTSVDSLQKHMEAVVPGLNLTNFFNDWVTKAGRVTYAVQYQYVTKGVYIRLTQSPTSGGAGYFDMPVPIRISNGSGLDTTIVIIDKRGVLSRSPNGSSYGTNVIFYPLSATPTIAPTLDPNSVVLATSSSVAVNNTLSGMITLPLTDIKLSVNAAANEAADIAWSFYSDEAIEIVELQRSYDAVSFTGLQTVTIPPCTSNVYRGTFTDKLSKEYQYYRLKITGSDGHVVYSGIEGTKNVSKNNLPEVYPNPVVSNLTLVLPQSFRTGETQVLIKNSLGQLVKSETLNASPGLKATLQVQDISPGLYSIWITDSKGERFQTNFIKTTF